MRRCAVFIAAFVCVETCRVAICTTPVSAQTALEKLRVTYSAIGGSQASVWIPYEAGIFRKNGLDVELLYVAGGGRAGQVSIGRSAHRCFYRRRRDQCQSRRR